MDAKIDAMDKDSLIAALSTCNEKMYEIKEARQETVKPLTEEMKTLKTTLTDYMVRTKCECLQIDDELFLRLFHRVGCGQMLTPMLFMEIINCLTPRMFLETLECVKKERLESFATWKEQKKKELQKSLRGESCGKKAKIDFDAIIDEYPRPDCAKDMTAAESLVEVLLLLIRERHKPVKPVITIDSRPGRSASITTVAPRPVIETVKRFTNLKTESGKLQQAIKTKRCDLKYIMDRCKTRLMPLLTSKYEGQMPTSEGMRKITLEVVRRPVVSKRLNLNEFQKILCEATKDVRGTPREILSEATIGPVIQKVMASMARFTEENTHIVEKVSLRRGRARDDDDSDESSSDDDD